jgi:hypothetical protein
MIVASRMTALRSPSGTIENMSNLLGAQLAAQQLVVGFAGASERNFA